MNTMFKNRPNNNSTKPRRTRCEKTFVKRISMKVGSRKTAKEVAWIWRQVGPSADIRIRRGSHVTIKPKTKKEAIDMLEFVSALLKHPELTVSE